MKKIVLLSFLMVAAFVACNKEEVEPSYVSVGSIEITGEESTDFIVKLDDGAVLTPVQVRANLVAEGERVLVEYSIVEKKSDSTYDVNVFDIQKILIKEIIQLTELNQDTIGNDPIHTDENNIWLSDKHLNIVFNYYGLAKVHTINLVRPMGEETHDEEGRLILEFRHNDNMDTPARVLRGLVAFEMESLRVADEESVDFVVRVQDFADTQFEWEGSYNFKNPQDKTLQAKKNTLYKFPAFNIQ